MAGGNQFAGLIGKGKRKSKEKDMLGLHQDIGSLQKKHSRNKDSALTDSNEYKNVQQMVAEVGFSTGKVFSSDVAQNEKMMTEAMGNYYKLLAACEAYIAKPGGVSFSGKARKNKVREIQKYAQRDLIGLEQAFYAMKSMDGQQQSNLSWDEIFHSARMESLEVDNYNDQNINTGAAAKSGDLMGKKFKEGFFSPEHIKKFSGNVGVKLNENSFASRSENAKVNEVETNVANRNVATSRIANLLGAGGLVEQSTNVKIHDKASNTIKKGSLMTKSKGDEALESVKTTIWSRMARITDVQEREELAKSKISPTLQKELSSLQVLDYICGQGDRHRANYFLETGDDKNKQYTHVHGIDNDCSFSTGVDAETVLKEQNQGVYDVAQHHRMVVDASGNLTIPHMDKQLATNILNLKEEEVRFALKDLLEEQFIDYTVQRLRLLQKGIRTELQKEKSEIFIEGGQWNDKTLEDFVQQSYRKKIMSHRKLETSFEKQIFFAQNNFKLDERYEMSKNDNYVATLIDEMMGFDSAGTFYRDFENTVKYQASLLRETKKYTKDEIVSIVAKNMNISEAEVRKYTNIK